jgi:hypothetical protein
MVRNVKDNRYAALKIFREEFLIRDQQNIKSVEKEIEILKGLNHTNMVDIL